jgi:hypothetical protein
MCTFNKKKGGKKIKEKRGKNWKEGEAFKGFRPSSSSSWTQRERRSRPTAAVIKYLYEIIGWSFTHTRRRWWEMGGVEAKGSAILQPSARQRPLLLSHSKWSDYSPLPPPSNSFVLDGTTPNHPPPSLLLFSSISIENSSSNNAVVPISIRRRREAI